MESFCLVFKVFWIIVYSGLLFYWDYDCAEQISLSNELMLVCILSLIRINLGFYFLSNNFWPSSLLTCSIAFQQFLTLFPAYLLYCFLSISDSSLLTCSIAFPSYFLTFTDFLLLCWMRLPSCLHCFLARLPACSHCFFDHFLTIRITYACFNTKLLCLLQFK